MQASAACTDPPATPPAACAYLRRHLCRRRPAVHRGPGRARGPLLRLLLPHRRLVSSRPTLAAPPRHRHIHSHLHGHVQDSISHGSNILTAMFTSMFALAPIPPCPLSIRVSEPWSWGHVSRLLRPAGAMPCRRVAPTGPRGCAGSCTCLELRGLKDLEAARAQGRGCMQPCAWTPIMDPSVLSV